MKRVTILSLHLGFGGIEKSVASLANILCSRYEVEIVSVYKLYDKPSFAIDKRVKIKYLLEKNKPNEKEFRDALSNHHYFTVIKEGFKAMRTLILRKQKTIDYIEKCNCDIMIATRDIFDEWVGKYAKNGVLKIGWEHNHHHGNMKYANKIVKSCSKLDYLVLVSNSLQHFYKNKMRGYDCKCVFIPNVIEGIPSNNSKLKEKRLISVGRLSQEKGYMDLLVIFKNINRDYPNWKLDIIGDGKERDKLEEYIKQNNLEKSVTLHGFREKDYIYNLLEKSSIYLMTSYTESFGIVLLEAMSVGLPCIAFSSAEGANEIIVSGSNGYIIKRRNFKVYIKKVEDLIENYDTRKKIGDEAKKSVYKYSSAVVGKKWFDLIER